jgi:hypothetical protein
MVKIANENGHPSESGEIVLANPTWKKNKGKFHSHQRNNGRERGNFDKSNITCYSCGRNGHFSIERRASKTGIVFSPNAKEAAAAQVKDKKKGKNKKDGMEIMLCQVTSQLKDLFTSVQSLLQDDEGFILDSGATYNSTFSS